MSTYKESGVDVELGDRCSKKAYAAAKATFAGRKGMIGEPVVQEGGFTGMLDMGDFYMIQNDDGVGTKIEVAEKMRKFDTLGYDLVAMVADDGICVGAEIVSITNTLDTPSLDEEMVEGLMAGLKAAAFEQKIVVPGGELAELGDALNGAVWNATAVGIVEKGKVIDGSDIKANDVVITLRSDGIRSNGLSLARMILKEKFGDDWVNEDFDGRSWGEVILTPSKIYHRAILSLIGGYKEKGKVKIKGLVHNTGGGILGNVPRLLQSRGFGANFHDLPEPHEFMLKLQELGNVEDDEAYKTWNMGAGMFVVVDAKNADQVLDLLREGGVDAQVSGTVTLDPDVKFTSKGYFTKK
ncbi:phosphoribosylformylglycinamidine cyclo-ligase [Patescibacteria group bacterium]|nr:phosphoribosylformylglycinamidine cyclo-ligase [Patescibacteria group bacterium]MBU1934822.1 phosphoribosylformylglycinamidine cyclo-ligase [Patescibacteria group bacterium]